MNLSFGSSGMANKMDSTIVYLISMIIILETTGFAHAASFSLTRGALLRTDRATGQMGRFDPHSKWGRYWINTMNQGSHRSPAYSSYGKRAFFEGFYYPYYSTDSNGNKVLRSELVNQQG